MKTNRMDWQPRAVELARACVPFGSEWEQALTQVPRHEFVPSWYTPGPDGWTVNDGPADLDAWKAAAYSDTTLVTRVGPHHADHAAVGERVTGRPTASSTHPSLVVAMLRHGQVPRGARLLDVGTGSGYSAALAAYKLGEKNVTSLDIDPYLTEAAAGRLDSVGLHPTVLTADAAGDLPLNAYDRIVSMVSVPSIPASWLAALRPGGRLVTTLSNTGLIITANATPDGGAVGRVEWDRAGFMATRTGDDYPPLLNDLFTIARDQNGEQITTSPYPVINIMEAWDIWSMLSLTHPGVEHRTGTGGDGAKTAWLLHADGSWARASTPPGADTATVHQGGPRRLWDTVDAIRRRWLHEGSLPVYGAKVTITPQGETTLQRGRWAAQLPSIPASKPRPAAR